MEKPEDENFRPEKRPFDVWLREAEGHWTWDWPHQLRIYEKLQMMTEGTAKRLMIFMPPRHSKSETVTVRYAAWRMLREPGMRVILGCYNQRLANRFSRKIRRLVDTRVGLSPARKAVDEWETKAGGGLCAVGVGAGVTGYGAELIVIDDPVKNRAEAESIAYRERTWDWFNDDIYTRLEPGASIVLIQTLWHEDDLAGRLLAEAADGGEEWEVLSLPAIAEEDTADWRDAGEALCPERYDRDAFDRIKKKIGSYAFASLYQQRPVPRDGGLFKRGWFTQVVEKAPEGLRWCRAYDLAISTKTSADYTASFRCAVDGDDNVYIADGFRGRIDYPEQQRYVLERFKEEPRTIHVFEEALHGRAFVQSLRREALRKGIALRCERVDRDKFTRALVWAALAEAGKVFLVRGAWMDEFIEEAVAFPGGKHDDQIDAVSLAVQTLTFAKRGKSHGF
ncbi:MAG: phage terminase large subunit [Acidobacteria bacterium]|nr:phage terminase large subunit [Acidobacteriota bacterium]